MSATVKEILCAKDCTLIDSDPISFEQAMHTALTMVPEAVNVALSINPYLHYSYHDQLKISLEHIAALVSHIARQAIYAVVSSFLITCSSNQKAATSLALKEIVGPQMITLVNRALHYYLLLSEKQKLQITATR